MLRSRTFSLFVLFYLLAISASPANADHVIRVAGGKFDRRDTPVFADVPKLAGNRIELVTVKSAERLPAQRDMSQPERIWWIEPDLPAGESRQYRIETDSGASVATVMSVVDNGQALVVSHGDRPVLHYQRATMPSPLAAKPEHARSGFIHPVFSPRGSVLTDPMPADHLHQHGIMFAWRKTVFEGREVNFWEDSAGQGRIEHVEVLHIQSGPVFADFGVRLQHVDLTAPGGPRNVLTETWHVRAFATDGPFVWDLSSSQQTAGPSPLLMEKFHYGGFMIRGAKEWTADKGDAFLTSAGKGRLAGNHTRPLWVDMHGTVDGVHAGLTVMGHPQNFRFPQPVRLHPSMPYFCFAPMVLGDFEITPAQPFDSRFRFVAHDGPLDRLQAIRLWRDWSDPPLAHLETNGPS